jgi:hypothetical protein
MAKALPPLSPLIWAWAQAASPDSQRWTFALSASVDEAIAVILFCLAWRPLARPLLFQFLALRDEPSRCSAIRLETAAAGGTARRRREGRLDKWASATWAFGVPQVGVLLLERSSGQAFLAPA